jgi:hypothetical protein
MPKAVQWTGEFSTIEEFISRSGIPSTISAINGVLTVSESNHFIKLNLTDWLIVDEDGHYSPCENEMFRLVTSD